MKYNSRSIYGCTMAEPEFKAPEGTLLTQSQDGKRLYVHILEYPYKTLAMENLSGKIEYCQFLHDASEVLYNENKPNFLEEAGTSDDIGDSEVRFVIPETEPDILIPVLEIFLKD